jgi:hypothetical protein
MRGREDCEGESKDGQVSEGRAGRVGSVRRFHVRLRLLCGKEEEKEEERGGKVGGQVSHGYYQYAPHHDTSRQCVFLARTPRRAGGLV